MRSPNPDEADPHPHGASRDGEVVSIQYLRGLAALAVVVFHAAMRSGSAFGVGAAGVDIFFAVSGFIMWTVTCQRETDPPTFLLRRAQRILPLYWLVTLAVAGLALAAPRLFPAMRPTLAHVTQSILFVPHRDPTGLIAPLIVPGWTLTYEVWFYLLFATCLLAPSRRRIWLSTAMLVGLVALGPLGDRQDPLWATATNPLLLEFAGGLWIGWARTQGRLPGQRLSWLALISGLAALAITAISGIDVEPARALYWGLPASLIVAGAVGLEAARPLPRVGMLRTLGDASYSVYLVHGLAISAAFRLLQAWPAPRGVVFVAALLAGLAAGFAVYRGIEQPLSRLFRARRGGQAGGGVAAGPAT